MPWRRLALMPTQGGIRVRRALLAFAVLACLSPMAGGLAQARARPERTFYVAPGGRDSNSGRSPAHPWRTVTRVDDAALRPGDRVLFEGGATFSDATLMPGQGFNASGAPGRPIVFGSYGRGQATLVRGVWLGVDSGHPAGPSFLTFSNLALGPMRGFQGTGSHISLLGLTIGDLLPPAAQQETGIQTEGSHWLIAGNRLERIGGSGMLLGANANAAGDPAGGRLYVVRDNLIADTGLDGGIGYPTHGIYLKVARARVTGNRIAHFRDDGISARYHDADLSNNDISGGQIGIAWYQYDRTPGRSRFIGNTITGMSVAGIFVCGVAEGCVRPIESFDIAGNAITGIHGVRMNLQPTSGVYVPAVRLR
jgi:hypothetical protein